MDRARRLPSLLILAFVLAWATPTTTWAAPPVASPAAGCPARSASPAASRPTDSADAAVADRIDTLLTEQTGRGVFSGAVLVARGDAVVLAKGYGLADRACGLPNTSQTTFRIGSITKQFTAMAIMQLQEAGALAVDDPITTYLPDFPTPERDGVAITIHHLLSHTSGIPELFRFYSPATQASWPATPHEMVYELTRAHPLDFIPGTAFSYSNTGYLVLGLIVEQAAGQPYSSYLREHIFDPIGMDATGFEAAGDARPDPAAGYLASTGTREVSTQTRLDIASSAGGMHSTVEDLYRWDRALANGRLVGRASLERIFTPVREGYGYGWFIGDFAGRPSVGHGGGIDGFVSVIVRFVEDDAVVIVLANQETVRPDAVAEQVAGAMFAT
jgi:CubicO group peptidase (beta-lactamase class C family)